ncbi:unnamed protein product [Durusdinium trenchii]|uniref:Uncharacterized protein n=1 Tax=Durusdinium trenchii TaxID=1381693 RepID=A0ABP0IX40_9DINO
MWTVHSQVPRQKSTKSRAWCSFMTWSTSRPVPGIHFLRLDKAYLKCDQSRAYVLAEPMKAASMPQRPFASFDVDRAKGRGKEDHVALSRRLKEPCPDPRSQDVRRLFA